MIFRGLSPNQDQKSSALSNKEAARDSNTPANPTRVGASVRTSPAGCDGLLRDLHRPFATAMHAVAQS
jgi:hypothetical protein